MKIEIIKELINTSLVNSTFGSEHTAWCIRCVSRLQNIGIDADVFSIEESDATGFVFGHSTFVRTSCGIAFDCEGIWPQGSGLDIGNMLTPSDMIWQDAI